MKTLEQEFAELIYPHLADYSTHHPEGSSERKQYGSMAHRLPVLVHTAGLVQALAFVENRGKGPHKELVDHLADVLGFPNREALLTLSRQAQFHEYRFLTYRVNLALTWFKCFAQSVLKVDAASKDN